MSRSINMAIIIGNLTRDPEMRYTPQGHAVTSFGVATNRVWVSNGERREDVEFHNVVAWNKLAELCHQLLKKGRRVYIQGRLQTRAWEGQDGVKRSRTEIVADDMIILDSKYKQAGDFGVTGAEAVPPEALPQGATQDDSSPQAQAGVQPPATSSSPQASQQDESQEENKDVDIKVEDIPF